MNAYDYLKLIQEANPRLFDSRQAKIAITAGEIERAIMRAFDAGKSVGVEEGKKSKSLFESIFG